jgi:hypothetical protein
MTIQRTLPDLAAQINAEHAACLAAASAAIGKAIDVGRLLVEAKAQVQHGEWAGWVEANCTFELRQAQNYMRAFAHRDEIEAQMRNGASHLTSLREAIAALAEPKALEGEPDVLRRLREFLDVMASPDWPPGETIETRVQHCEDVRRYGVEVQQLGAEYCIRLDRAMGERLKADEGGK